MNKSRHLWKYFFGVNVIGVSYLMYRQGQTRFNKMQFADLYNNLQIHKTLGQEYLYPTRPKSLTFTGRCLHIMRFLYRLIELMIVFAPVMVTLPMVFIPRLYQRWLRLMVRTLEFAGPLWVKLGQWASHRSDVFGPDITKALSVLRDSAKLHAYKHTKAQFQKEFSQDIDNIFTEIESIASGSIGQVYKAKYNGQSVAIKVRHPTVLKSLQMDLEILYRVSNAIAVIPLLKRLAMPVTFEEFSQTLLNQTDFRFEGSNLQIFNLNFKDSPNIVFPKVILPYMSESVLVETFEEGTAFTDFMRSTHTREHAVAANLGLKSFYKMLMYDNFIHADLHSGNILVRITPKDNQSWIQNKLQFTQEWFYQNVEILTGMWIQLVQQIINILCIAIERFILPNNQSILEQEKKADEMHFWQLFKFEQSKHRVDLVFIDPGMVTILNQQDRIDFIKIIMFVALRKPKECGELMLQLSQYKNLIQQEKRVKFLSDIDQLFGELCNVPLGKMNLGLIFRGMLDILRENELSIEGHFATLLTNMMILESIGRELDPELNIVSKAASFLLQLKTVDETLSALMSQ